MKRSDQSWAAYLQEGIAHMEGTSPAGRRSFKEAETIFEACMEQEEDTDVHVEARFRCAQLAYYEGKDYVFTLYIKAGKEKLSSLNSPEKEAQCRLIEGIVLENSGLLAQATQLYKQLWKMDLQDPKLRGDIANRMARVVEAEAWKYKTLLLRHPAMQKAVMWIMRSLKCFESIKDPDADTYHAVAAVKARAARLMQYRSYHLWEQANQLFKEGKVRDPWLRATYWLRRSQTALYAIQPFRSAWFFLRFLWAAKNCNW